MPLAIGKLPHVVSQDTFGIFLVSFGANWVPLGPLWSHLGDFGGALGRLQGALGCLWGALRRRRVSLRVHFDASGAHLVPVWALGESLGSKEMCTRSSPAEMCHEVLAAKYLKGTYFRLALLNY